jgi:hypothetical protein
VSEDHLHPLDEGWSVWKRFCVRGAGFPADGVLALASPTAAACSDELLAIETELPGLRAAAVEECRRALAAGDRNDPVLRKILKALLGARLPASPAGPPSLLAAIAAVADAQRRHEEASARLQASLADESVRAGSILRTVAAEPRFREALSWQNPAAVAGALDSLQRVAPGTSNHDTRKRELMIASYLQRYCLKNESIGFFGPYGWGRMEADGPPLAVRPGRGLLASRTVYFEHWPMAMLAERLAEDERVRDALMPRLHPLVRIDGASLVRAGRAQEVPLPFARAAAACDGRTPVARIVEQLLADEELQLSEPEEVRDLLAELAHHRVILLTLELPATPTRPDLALRGALEELGDPGRPGLAALDRLESARARLAAAEGESERMAAMQALERTFAEESGGAATRNAGVTYGARTTVYEDCRRDLDLRLGPALLARVAPTLRLLLQSARWLTHSVAVRYRRALTEIYRELGGAVVDYADFARRADDLFSDDVKQVPPLVGAVGAELRERWAAALAVPADARLVRRSSAELHPALQASFAAPAPGFPSAREHCPDLLIAAASVEALGRGEGLFVLGELHLALNTLVVPSCLQQAIDPEELVLAHERDLPRRVAPVMPMEARNRAVLVSPSRHDLDVETGSTRSFRPRAQVIAHSQLVVVEENDRLVVRTRDGAHQFDVIEFLDQRLSNAVAAEFGVLPEARHQPRVVIDELVVARETWRFETADLDFTGAPAAELFVRARAWAHHHGLPRFAFVKSSLEIKPCFIDFDSPTFVSLLAKLCRGEARLTVSEMLPSPEDVWLPDAEGNRYTCELRLVSVDPEPWQP